MSSAAGPSCHGRSLESESSESPETETQRRKRKRVSGIEEVFERQDPEEKTRIGKGYREMQMEADDMKANVANVTAKQLTDKLKQQSKLFSRLHGTDTATATLDARLIMTTTDTAMGLARKLRIEGNAFDVDDFLIRVKGKLGLDRAELEDQSEASEDELDESLSDPGRRFLGARKGTLGDWEKIGWMAAGLLRRVPGIEFMYGPLKVEHKKRTIARRARRRSLEPEVRPEEIQSRKGGGKRDDTLSHVITVGKVLDELDGRGEGINFFKLVVNPDDFGQTVENVFFVSFLIRDGRAGIEVGKDGEVIIKSCEPHDPETDGNVPKNQAVIELDMETWEEAKRVFNITKSAIPHRVYERAVPMASNRWYT